MFTGLTWFASEVLEEQLTKTGEQRLDSELSHLRALTEQAVDVLEGGDPEAARLARYRPDAARRLDDPESLSRSVSPNIDALYYAALSAGATGGKLRGAGAAG